MAESNEALLQLIWNIDTSWKTIKRVLQENEAISHILLYTSDKNDSGRNLLQKTAAMGDFGRFKNICGLYQKCNEHGTKNSWFSVKDSNFEDVFTIALKSTNEDVIRYLRQKGFTKQIEEAQHSINRMEKSDAECDHIINMLDLLKQYKKAEELEKDSMERKLAMTKFMITRKKLQKEGEKLRLFSNKEEASKTESAASAAAMPTEDHVSSKEKQDEVDLCKEEHEASETTIPEQEKQPVVLEDEIDTVSDTEEAINTNSAKDCWDTIELRSVVSWEEAVKSLEANIERALKDYSQLPPLGSGMPLDPFMEFPWMGAYEEYPTFVEL